MKLKVSTWRITWRYLLATLVVTVAFMGFFSTTFVKLNEGTGRLEFIPWGVLQYVVMGLIIAFIIAFYFITIFNYYYVIEDRVFIVKKYGRTVEYTYNNIEFIDIDESKRKKLVIFYAPTCRTRYLLADKDNVLLDTLIKKCPPTMSVQDFKRKHPEERY